MARLKGLYITADAVGTPTGGGKVTHHEWTAMLAACGSTDAAELWQFPDGERPWGADLAASARLLARPELAPVHAHFYAGTFTKTIRILKSRGTYVTYTAAAHDIAISKHEHEMLGMPFDYPHLTDPTQWAAYVGGYLMADELICPSEYSARIMHEHDLRSRVLERRRPSRIRVIPHGYDPVEHVAPMPRRFTVGYLGQPGPDKGLRHLIAAWELLTRALEDRSRDMLLIIAGRGTLALAPMVRRWGSGSVYLRGEVVDPRELYDACCVYVQPSASEGFGCEVLEARAHGRPVICSDAAGARDHATWVVPSGDRIAFAAAIDAARERWARHPDSLAALARRDQIAPFTWEKIRGQYEAVFRSAAWLPPHPLEPAP